MRKLGMVMAVRRTVGVDLYELYLDHDHPVWHILNPNYVEADYGIIWLSATAPAEEQLAQIRLQQERYEEVTKEAMASETGVGFRSYDPHPRRGQGAQQVPEGEGSQGAP